MGWGGVALELRIEVLHLWLFLCWQWQWGWWGAGGGLHTRGPGAAPQPRALSPPLPPWADDQPRQHSRSGGRASWHLEGQCSHEASVSQRFVLTLLAQFARTVAAFPSPSRWASILKSSSILTEAGSMLFKETQEGGGWPHSYAPTGQFWSWSPFSHRWPLALHTQVYSADHSVQCPRLAGEETEMLMHDRTAC